MRSSRLHTVLLFVALCCSMLLSAQQESSCVVCNGDYPAVRVGTDDWKQISDSIFYTDALEVEFVVNKWDIPANSELVRTLRDVIIPCTIEKGWRLDHIAVRGAASPDGPWDNNKMLADKRTKAISDLVLSMLPAEARPKAGSVAQSQVVEDYPRLVFMMRQAGDSLAEQVADIVEANKGYDLRTKRQLMALDGGKVWNYLRKAYFPDLRAARVLFFMTKASETPSTPSTLGTPGTPATSGTPSTLKTPSTSSTSSSAPVKALPNWASSWAAAPAGDGVDPDECCRGTFPLVMLTPESNGQVTDEMFYEGSLQVTFDLNKYNISDTAELLRVVREQIIPCTMDKGWRLDHVAIRGAASPEGSYANNKRLAHNRMLAFQDKLLSLLPENARPKKSDFTVQEVVEDYGRLVYNLKKADDPLADTISAIVSSHASDEAAIKRELMALNGGQSWNYLKREYFPELRSASVLFFMTRMDEDIIEQTPASVLLKEEDRRFYVRPYSLLSIYEPIPEKKALPDVYWVNPFRQTVVQQPDSSLFIPRKELLNIKTNLLLDFAWVKGYGMAYILNGQLEYYPKHGHITPVISFDGPWWTYRSAEHKYFEVRNYQVEGRWYFRREDARYDGFYAGLYGHGMLYNVGFNKDQGWEGEGWGVGASAGYVVPLGKRYRHIKLELGLQVGYFRTKYDPYVYGCPVEQLEDGLYYYLWLGKAEDFVPRQWRWEWFGPTRLGISISYDLLYRKHERKGVSFKWHE